MILMFILTIIFVLINLFFIDLLTSDLKKYHKLFNKGDKNCNLNAVNSGDNSNV